MWKVRETKRIGVKTFWELYEIQPGGETIIKGKWKYKEEAQKIADKLNKEKSK